MIGIDQYVAVVNPLHYHRNVNEFRCKLMCLSAWIVSICLVILTSIDQSIEYQFVANLVTLTLAYVIPIGAILVIYFRIFIAARSNSIKTRRNSSCSMTQEGVLSHNTVCNFLLNLCYGNTGYGVSSRSIQNQQGFCLKINIPKGIY